MSARGELVELAAFAAELAAALRRPHAARASVERLKAERLRAVLQAYAVAHGLAQVPRGLFDVAPMGKRTLLDGPHAGVTDARVNAARLLDFIQSEAPGTLLFDELLVATTSGTTGEIGVFVNDRAGWARTRAIVFARMFQGLLGAEGFAKLVARRYRLAFVIATGGHTMTAMLANRVPRVGRAVMQSRTLSIDAPLAATVDALNAYAPMLLHSYPTFLEVLAAEKRAGRLRVEPELLSLGSEPVTPSCRAALVAAFPRARIVETYAATECLAMATSCERGTLHVNEDACILEPVDDDGNPVPLGTAGRKTLVTNLLNTTQPLVRYELHDSLALLDGPCACGSPFQRVEVQGRTDDTFFLVDVDGRVQSHPPIPLEVAFFGIAGLLQYQLIHEQQNHLRMIFVAEEHSAGATVARAIDARLSAYLDAHGLRGVTTVFVEQTDALLRHARSKKLRQITSRVGRPPGEAVPAAQLRR